MTDIGVRKRYVKENQQADEEGNEQNGCDPQDGQAKKKPPTQYINQKI